MANNDERRGPLAGVRPRRGSSGEPRRMRSSPWVWILGFLRDPRAVQLPRGSSSGPRSTTPQFLEHVENGEIVETLEISQTSVTGDFQARRANTDFTTTIPPILQGDLAAHRAAERDGVEYTGVTAERALRAS